MISIKVFVYVCTRARAHVSVFVSTLPKRNTFYLVYYFVSRARQVNTKDFLFLFFHSESASL